MLSETAFPPPSMSQREIPQYCTPGRHCGHWIADNTDRCCECGLRYPTGNWGTCGFDDLPPPTGDPLIRPAHPDDDSPLHHRWWRVGNCLYRLRTALLIVDLDRRPCRYNHAGGCVTHNMPNLAGRICPHWQHLAQRKDTE